MNRTYGGIFLSQSQGNSRIQKTAQQVIEDRIEKEKEKLRPKNFPLPIGYKSSKSTEGSFDLRANSVNINRTLLNEQARVYRL
jgi:hypothetical protein